jgi:hypothetical protein
MYKLRHYRSFCSQRQVSLVPATDNQFEDYVAFRVTATQFCLRASSLRQELSAIVSLHVDSGHWFDVSACRRLKRMLCGLRRWQGVSRDTRRPVTRTLLIRMLALLSQRDFTACVLRAALCVAFFGMLRISEFTVPSLRQPVSSSLLRCSMIRFFPSRARASYCTLRIPQSKTDQFRSGHTIVLVCGCPAPCAVHELLRMLSFRHVRSSSEALFVRPGGVLLTVSFFSFSVPFVGH